MAGNSSQWSGVGPNFQQRGGVQEGHHRWWPLNKEGERFVRLRRSNDEYRYWLYAANPPPSKNGGPVIFSFPQMAFISKCCFAECGCYLAVAKDLFVHKHTLFIWI
jgi:hypothetical protein